MPGVARVAADFAGGSQIGGGQDFVFCEGLPIVVLGDPVMPHSPGGKHLSANMVQASSFVYINNKPICRAGDKADCGHPSTGSAFMSSE